MDEVTITVPEDQVAYAAEKALSKIGFLGEDFETACERAAKNGDLDEVRRLISLAEGVMSLAEQLNATTRGDASITAAKESVGELLAHLHEQTMCDIDCDGVNAATLRPCVDRLEWIESLATIEPPVAV